MACARCGAENPTTNKFCLQCGAPLVAPTDPAQRSVTPSNPVTAMGDRPYAPYAGSPTGSVMMKGQGELVGFGTRFAAYLIDWIIFVVVTALLNAIHLGPLGSVFGLAYFAYFWTTTGQTPGMKVIGIKVIRTDGQQLGIGTAAVRYLGYIVSALPFLLGFLWIIWDGQKQGFHDKLAGTVVVRTS